MSRLDAVIFGATGFTGKQTVIHMIEFAKKYQLGSWGIAGRSATKLDDVLREVSKKTGADLSGVKVIIADVGDEKSVQEMCAQTKVVINCCGPYVMYGEPVVKAAVENKTHYVDVSGEPKFMESMQLRYNEQARQAGVFIISACGWDSIPCDMGVTFLQQNFEGTLNSVRVYMSLHITPEALAKAERRGTVNFGTWESLVYGIANYGDQAAIRKKLFPEPLPALKPKLHRTLIHKKDAKSKYFLPFLGADESVVYRTQRYLYETEQQRPVQFKAYFRSGNIFQTLLIIYAAILLYIMTKFSFTRNLLLNYPKVFTLGNVTKEGPTDVVMNNSFFKFEFVGEGWEKGADILTTKPNKMVKAKVSGKNPGYGATCVALLSAAVTILQEREKMPTGGVMTTGAAFRNTNIIQKLVENDLKYEIVSK